MHIFYSHIHTSSELQQQKSVLQSGKVSESIFDRPSIPWATNLNLPRASHTPYIHCREIAKVVEVHAMVVVMESHKGARCAVYGAIWRMHNMAAGGELSELLRLLMDCAGCHETELPIIHYSQHENELQTRNRVKVWGCLISDVDAAILRTSFLGLYYSSHKSDTEFPGHVSR